MSASQPRLRLDRSRPFATIHGARTAGDPHLRAKFQQDGIHFDGSDLHIDDLVIDLKVRELVDRRLKKVAKNAPKKDGAGEAQDDPDDDSGSSPDGEVNLGSWLRGEAKYQWFQITKAVRDRYSKQITTQVDMVNFLVLDEKIVPPNEVDPQLAAVLKQQG